MWVKVVLLGCICAIVGVQAEFRLRIIHTNDMHARFVETSRSLGECSEADAAANSCFGGFARIKTAAATERKKAEKDKVPIIFLNGGDSFSGTVWYSHYKWAIVAFFMKFLGIDAMSPGNHEFDQGPEGYAPFLKNISIPVVVCNMDVSAEPKMMNTKLKPSVVIDRGSLKIGVIGYVTTDTPVTSSPGDKIVFNDEINYIDAEAKKLKAKGVKIIIALGHSGYDKDQEIAAGVPDVDVVVGGHSHTFLYTGKQPDREEARGPYPTMVTQSTGRIVPVVQAYYGTKYLGSFEVVFSDAGEVIKAFGNPILLDKKIEPDAAVLAELAKWYEGIATMSKEVLSKVRVILSNNCRSTECNLGNLITDAFIDFGVRNLKNTPWTEAAIALMQAGGIRAPINKTNGVITRGDLIGTMPFFNQIEAFKIQGKYLVEALEASVQNYDVKNKVIKSAFFQVSGLHVIYDVNQAVGSRVVKVTVRCAKCLVPTYQLLDPDASYGVICSSFIANGGDKYAMFKEHKQIIKKFAEADTDVVANYLKNEKLVYVGREDRIQLNSSPSIFSINPILFLICAIFHFYYQIL